MVCYDLAHQIKCAMHTFSGRCDARLVGIAHHSFYSVVKVNCSDVHYHIVVKVNHSRGVTP